MSLSINIHTETILTIKDLSPGDHYIRVATLRKRGPDAAAAFVRIRTDNPWSSRTIYGAKVQAVPRDKVHPVDVDRGRE